MLIDLYAEVVLSGSNISYYRNLGYEIPERIGSKGKPVVDRYSKIKVKVSDLPNNSTAKVLVECDRCHKQSMVIYENYQKCMHKYGEYFCQKCSHIHAKETIEKLNKDDPTRNDKITEKRKATLNDKYGVDFPLQNKDILEKVQKTNLERYGVPNIIQREDVIEKKKLGSLKKYGTEYPFQSDLFYEENKDILLKKYGIDHVSKIPEVRQKVNDAFYNNSKQKVSFQQQYIYDLIKDNYKCELNYLFQKYFLDIYLSDYNIDIEIDGGGHNLLVKTNKISEEEFKKKELVRENQIRRKGINVVRIVMPTDKLPSDNTILKIIDNSIKYFKDTKNTWIYYYPEENKIKNKEHKNGVFFDFGNLRDSYKLHKDIKNRKVDCL